MAHPKETREKLRRLYVSDGQTLEIAAMMCDGVRGGCSEFTDIHRTVRIFH